MDQNQTQQITNAIGSDDITSEQQERLMTEVSQIVVESALNRLLVGLSGEEGQSLEKDIDNVPEADLMDFMLEKFPQFGDYIKEESEALQSDIEKVFA